MKKTSKTKKYSIDRGQKTGTCKKQWLEKRSLSKYGEERNRES